MVYSAVQKSAIVQRRNRKTVNWRIARHFDNVVASKAVSFWKDTQFLHHVDMNDIKECCNALEMRRGTRPMTSVVFMTMTSYV